MTSTVQINRVSDDVIAMIWSKSPIERDIQQAYNQITDLLNHTSHRIYVLVDISCNPQFPVGATVKGALMGPHRHPKLRAWVVIGNSILGHMIAHILTALSNTSNIIWFDTEAEAQAYLAANTTSLPIAEVQEALV